MKFRILLLVGFSLITFYSWPQKPEPVYSIVKQLKPYEWYVSQVNAWEKEIKKDSLNPNAWYNYYIANRMANLTGKPEKWENKKDVILEDMSDIVSNMGRLIPESFEYNHVKWWNGGNNFDLFPYLEKAYKINPSRSETYDDFITYYEVKRDVKSVEKFCKMWYDSRDISQGILNFSYNMLMSTENNAILFTAGDNDTYPNWILQYVLGVRQDVTILNTSLLFIDEYKNVMLKELNITPFEKSPEDFYSDDIKNSGDYQTTYNNYQKALIKHIIENSGEKTVYFSITSSKNVYGQFEDDLYIEGLAFRYNKLRYDNIAVLRRNVEQRFLLDYLKIDFTNDISISVVDHTNYNYILPFITLYDHYKLAGDNYNASVIKDYAQLIANKKTDEELIMKQFE